MSSVVKAFDAFNGECRRLGIAASLGEPASVVPALVLGQPVDPCLAALYAAHDGARWSASDFALSIYPLAGPDSLEWRNESLRRSADDFSPPYPFGELILFAQYGLQASHLALAPALADDGGRQPVLYLDLHEEPWAVPVASDLDQLFALLARYLDRAMGPASPGEGGIEELNFPFDIGDLVGSDSALVERVKAGEFERLARGDASIEEWMAKTFQQDERT
jgi:hypothetical protein